VLVTNGDYILKNLISYKPSYLRSITPLYSPDDTTKQNPRYEYYFTKEAKDQTGITYYNILTKNSRVKNLYAMILGYKPEGKVNQEMILFGYMDNNVIYTKSEEKE
ncbi:hypothetical protein, partial [uncultured Megamonas sp.]|uniref:hypothetical protein n=1 Tax=uncultured Megamonas sp. TaxID=286140 RepID=UPI00259A3A84